MPADSFARKSRIALALLLLLATTNWTVSAKKKTAEPVAIRTFDVAVHGGLVYVAETTGLIAYRVSETGQPEPVGKVGLPGSVRRLAIQDDRAYLAVGAQGLFVIDIANPEEMTILARYDPPGPVEHVLLRGATAYLAEDRDGLSILDLSEPTRPRRLSSVSTRGQLRALALHGDRLALAEGTGAVRLFDVSRPARPRKLFELREADGARDVALRGGVLFVAAGRAGLLVFEPEASSSPIGRLAASSSATAVSLQGDLALVANGGWGLQIVDIADPTNPQQVGSLRLPGHPSVRRAFADGVRVYIAADVGGLAVAEIPNPRSPKLLYPRERKMQIRLR